jgi:hypothetical protein
MAQVWVRVQRRESKLATRARWGIFLGVVENTKGWKFLIVDRNTLVIFISARWHENLFFKRWKKMMVERAEMDQYEVHIEEEKAEPSELPLFEGFPSEIQEGQGDPLKKKNRSITPQRMRN